MTLFEKFDAVLDTDILISFSDFYDQPAGDLGKAMSGIFYTMVAGLVRRSNSAMSTGMMVSQIKKNNTVQVASFDFTRNKIEANQLDGIVAIGQKSISQIFPAFKSPLLNLISTYAGTGKQVTIGFIGYITSYIIKELGEMLEKDNFDSDDLILYLQGHREGLFEHAPKELMEKMIPALGLQEINTMRVSAPRKKEVKVSKDAEEAYVERPSQYESAGADVVADTNRWIFLALAAVALAVIAYFIFQNKESLFSKDEDTSSTVIEQSDEMVAEVDSIPSEESLSNVDLFTDYKKGVSSSAAVNGELIDLKAFTFEGDLIELPSEILQKGSEVVSSLKENPRLQVQIIGNHNGVKDNIGLKRAFVLKKYLLDNGIDNLRIDAASGTQNSNSLQIKIISK